MPPEIRIIGLSSHLPGSPITCRQLAETLGVSADVLERTAIPARYHAAVGQGPSDLAREAAGVALERARTAVEDLGLLIFATATPDVTFPGAACYLQEKLGAATIGALDVRAQSAGFLCALELAASFAAQGGSEGSDGRYARVMVAAGEVLSSGLDESSRGADLAARLADGAAVAIVGPGDDGLRVGAIRWHVDGALADRFWCEFPASRHHPHRISAADLAEGRHHPRASLEEIAPVVREQLAAAVREVLEEMEWAPDSVDSLVIDYVDPVLARETGEKLGFPASSTTVPTAHFGHVMAAGLPIALDRLWAGRRLKGRIVLAAAGPGLAWGAAALEA
jgi:3-oxoacyl-[acyl-carrier-protein] synthase III